MRTPLEHQSITQVLSPNWFTLLSPQTSLAGMSATSITSRALKGGEEGRGKKKRGSKVWGSHIGIKIMVLWDVMLCIMVKSDVYQSFRGTCCLHLRDRVSQHRRESFFGEEGNGSRQTILINFGHCPWSVVCVIVYTSFESWPYSWLPDQKQHLRKKLTK